jgi:Dolichyl-phosphate-mannose-protein mannosyltransferase
MTSVSGVAPVTIELKETRPNDADGSVGTHRTYSVTGWLSKRPNAWAWALLILIVLGAGAIRLRVLDTPLDRDEGEYAYFAQLLLQGIPPYAQAYNFKMPGIYAVYALMLAILGETSAGIHLGLLIATSLTIVLMFLVAARLFEVRVAIVAAATFAALSLSPRFFFTAAYAEHFVLPVALAGMLVLLAAGDRRGVVRFLGSGALFGTAFIVKQSGGAFALFAVLYVLTDTRRDAQRRLAASGALVAGAVAPFVAVCLLMLQAGTFPSFWFWTVTYAAKYGTAMSLAVGKFHLAQALRWILPTSYLVALLAGLGLSALFWDAKTRARLRFIAILLVTSVLATSAGLYFRPQYFILLLPVFGILAGVAVEAIARRLSSVRPTLRYGIPVALAAIPLLHLVYLERAMLFTDSPRQVLRTIYGVNPFPESVEIARYISERTSADERIAVVGSEPQIYFYAQRLAATGYIYTYALMEHQPYAAGMQRQMIHEIEAWNPRFVVFVNVYTSWILTPDSDKTIFTWFDQYQRRFDRVGFVEIISAAQTRYVWGPEAAVYTPRSDIWLAIFERKTTAGDR